MRTTKATELLPKIEWEEFEQIETDPEERMKVVRCEGEGTDGKTYTGAAYYFSGIFDEIKDISEA